MNQFACSIIPVLFLISSPSLSLKAFSVPLIARAAQAKTYVKGWDLTSSPPYKCGDSSPRRNLRIGKRSLNGVDASQIVACKQVLHNLHVRFKSRNALPRLKSTNKIFSFLDAFRSDRPLPLGSFPLTVSVPVSQPMAGISLQDEVGISTNNIVPKAALEGRGLYPSFLVTVTNVRYLGRQVQGKYELYEAADSWIAVTVTCTNMTGKRQRSDESPISSIMAELIDTYGRKHDVKARELKYDSDLLSKPYELNETRTEVWLFDVRSGTQASQLVLNVFDENGVRLQLW